MNLVELAQRIKNLRLAKRLTLEQVASQAGLTPSWLSKVENFRVTPSLTALGEIAAALEIPISQLMDGLDSKPQLISVNKSERLAVDRDGDRSNIKYESLAYKRPARSMDPFLLTLQGHDTSREPLSHEGEEFLMMVSGQAELIFGSDVYPLSTGDCLYFDGNTRHCLVNPHDEPAEVLCVFYARQQRND